MTKKKELKQRLENVNQFFRKKTSAVYGDEEALDLIFYLDRIKVENIDQFNFAEDGLSLAKLTAANLCEIGAKVIYITDAGMNFVETMREEMKEESRSVVNND